MPNENVSGSPVGATVGGEPEVVEVKLGDASFKVSKDIAAAIKASQDAAAEATTKASQKVTALETEVAALKTKPTAGTNTEGTPDPKKNPDRMFSDPAGFIADLKAEIREEIAGAYTADQARKEFWGEFYAANPELREHDFYVKSVFQREIPTMGKMQVPDALKHLGTTVKADLLKLSGKPGDGTGKRQTTEAGNQHQTSGSNAEGGSEHSQTTETPKSLTGLLLQRREARRTSAQPRAKA